MSKVDLSPFEGMVHPNYLRSGFHVFASFASDQASNLRPEIAKQMIGRDSIAMSFKNAGEQTLVIVGFNKEHNATAFYDSLSATQGVTVHTMMHDQTLS